MSDDTALSVIEVWRGGFCRKVMGCFTSGENTIRLEVDGLTIYLPLNVLTEMIARHNATAPIVVGEADA